MFFRGGGLSLEVLRFCLGIAVLPWPPLNMTVEIRSNVKKWSHKALQLFSIISTKQRPALAASDGDVKDYLDDFRIDVVQTLLQQL